MLDGVFVIYKISQRAKKIRIRLYVDEARIGYRDRHRLEARGDQDR